MSFWANYVIAKEAQGVTREVSLGKIEAKYGIEMRQQIELEIGGESDGNNIK